MKKTFLFVLLCFMLLTLISCARQPIVAFLIEGTSAGSDLYTVNLSFVEDELFKDKYVDILIKSSVDNLSITFKKEFEEDCDLFVENKDDWQSLTNLINISNSNQDEKFMPYNEKENETLFFESNTEATLTIKVVAGDKMTNSEDVEILVNQVDISRKFNLDI